MEKNYNFEEQFKNLGEFYMIDSPGEIRDFLKSNANIFILLDEVRPYLLENFLNESFNLEMVYDQECEDENHLVLRIYVSSERFHNGVNDDIEHIREKLRPLRRKYHVLSEFAVRAGVRHV